MTLFQSTISIDHKQLHYDLQENWVHTKDDYNAITELDFISFNYTSTIVKAVEQIDTGISTSVTAIHGLIMAEKYPIVFGFGDDTNHKYTELESDSNSECLRHIKSFYYPMSNQYQNVLSLLEGGDFEVFVLGHSCGQSDKTLLKTIFEHKSCIRIKVFHQGDPDEFFWKSMAISKHFSDKVSFRKKLQPYDATLIIPQYKNKNPMAVQGGEQ